MLNCQDIRFTKWVDKTSPVLFYDCASGKHISEGVHLTVDVAEVEAALAKDGIAHPEIEVLWQAEGPPGATIPRSGTGPTFSFEKTFSGIYEVKFTVFADGTKRGSETVKLDFAKSPVTYKPGSSPSGSSTSGTTKTGGTSPTAGTSTGATAAGCAVVHPEQSCTFTATGATIVLAGTGNGAFYIENLRTKQGSSFPARTTGNMFTPVKGDTYVVRDYSNANMTVRQ